MDEIRKSKRPDPDRWTISPDMALQLTPLVGCLVLFLVAWVGSLVARAPIVAVFAVGAGLAVVVVFLWRKLRSHGIL